MVAKWRLCSQRSCGHVCRRGSLRPLLARCKHREENLWKLHKRIANSFCLAALESLGKPFYKNNRSRLLSMRRVSTIYLCPQCFQRGTSRHSHVGTMQRLTMGNRLFLLPPVLLPKGGHLGILDTFRHTHAVRTNRRDPVLLSRKGISIFLNGHGPIVVPRTKDAAWCQGTSMFFSGQGSMEWLSLVRHVHR